VRQQQRDDSDEIVLVDSAGSPTPGMHYVSGSTEWPDDAGDIVGGGEHGSPSDDPVDGTTVGRASSAWDEIQSLPTLEDAPLRAEELRNEPRFEPADHLPNPEPAKVGALIQPAGTIRSQPFAPAVRRPSRLAAFLRIVFTAISVLILMAGLGLLIWALLSPPQPGSTTPTRLDAAPSAHAPPST